MVKYKVWTPHPAASSKTRRALLESVVVVVEEEDVISGVRDGNTLVDRMDQIGSLFRSAEGESILTAEDIMDMGRRRYRFSDVLDGCKGTE